MNFKQYIFRAASPEALISEVEINIGPSEEVVFKRYLLSNPEQKSLFPEEQGAVSYIVQPPLDGSAVAAWVLTVANSFQDSSAVGSVRVTRRKNITEVQAGPLTHIFRSNILALNASDSAAQTRAVLEEYAAGLQADYGLTLADDCVRTWFFCHDIDRNYAGLVRARREFFTEIGLTPQTHYIASTGIFGTPVEKGAVVQMDAYAIAGLKSGDQRYLYAPTHLNPTYEYGVTFERGVLVDGEAIISGTASIDNKGRVLHIGDVRKQTLRMWENVETLLSEAGKDWTSVPTMLVYIRNREDYAAVEELFSSKFDKSRYVILLAPVCRPDWLIEMECITSMTKK